MFGNNFSSSNAESRRRIYILKKQLRTSYILMICRGAGLETTEKAFDCHKKSFSLPFNTFENRI